MSDVNANIGIHFDTNDALAQLRRLQAGLSKFNQSLTQGNIAAENAQKGLNAQLMQSINATGKFVASQKTVSSSTTAFTDALEKNKLSMGQYFKFTAAAATANTKVFKNAFASEREIINRARKDRVKALQTQYVQLTSANGELVKVLQVVPKHLKMVNGEYTDYATRTQMAAQRQQLLNQLLKQGSTQLLNFGKNTQWAGRQLMVGFTVPLTMLGSVAAKAFKEMEEAVIKLQRVYGDMYTSAADTDKAVKGIQLLAKEFTKYGIAASETVKMAADAAAMGLTGGDLTAQVTAATRLAVLGQVEQQEALATTISLQNAFGISAEELAKKINFLNAVENQTVLSIADLTTAIPKAGPVVKQLGGSVEDLAFFMTAMKEGGINASEGANALKSGLASIINPSKKASEMLAGFGINIKGLVNANAGDLKGTVLGFARALDTLAPLERARAIETMFGKFQFARLSTLFQNITKDSSQAARAFGLAGASVEELAILSERELGKVENAVGVKFQKQMENLKLQLVPIGKAFLEAVTPIVKFASGILEKFNNLSDGTKKFVVGMVGFLGLIAPAALMTFGLVANGVANLIKFFAMLRGGMAKLNGQNNILGGGFDYLTQQEIENLAQSNALHTSHKDLISTFNVEAASVNALATAYANASSQARALASGSPGLFNAVPGPKGAVSGLPKFGNGGVVPGTGNKDTVAAMLTPGEVVLTKDTVKNNPELVAALQNDAVKKYNGGTGGGSKDISARLMGQFVEGGGGTAAFKGRMASLIEGAMSETQTGLARVIRFAKASGVEITAEQTDAIEYWRKEMLKAVEEAGNALVDQVDLSREKIKNRLKTMSPIAGTQAEGKLNTYDLIDTHGNQGQAKTFAHTEKSAAVSYEEALRMAKGNKAVSGKVQDIQAGADYLNNLPDTDPRKPKTRIQPEYTPVSAAGFEGITQDLNKDLDLGRASVDSFLDEFENLDPVKAWGTSLTNAGVDTRTLTAEIQHLHSVYAGLVREFGSNNDVMSDSDLADMWEMASNDPTVDPRLRTGLKKASNNVSAVRLSGVSSEDAANIEGVIRSGEVNRVSTGKTVVPKSGSAIGGEAGRKKRLGVFSEELDADLTRAEVDIAQTQSPSKRTKRLGINIGEGLRIGLEQKTKEVKSQADKLSEASIPKVDTANQAKYDALKNDPNQRQIQKSIDRHYRNQYGATKIPVSQPSESTETSLTVDINPQELAADAMAVREARKKAKELDKQASEAEASAAKMRIEAAKWEEVSAKSGGDNMYANDNVAQLKKQADKAELMAAQLRIQAAEEMAKVSSKSKKSGSMSDAVKSTKSAAREAGKTKKAQAEVTDATEDLALEQEKYKGEVRNGRRKAKKTAEASGDILVAEQDVARNTNLTATASQTVAQNTVTAAQLSEATEVAMGDSANTNQQIANAEDDRAKSAEEIAKLENDIEAQKRKLKEEGMRAIALQQQQNSIIPDGAQTDNKFVNPVTAMGYEDAYNEASEYTRDKDGQILFDPETKQPTTLTKKQLVKKQRGMRREKVSKYSGKASGVLGTATMVAGMAGAPPQVTAALGAASTVAQFAPMLAGMGPVGWAIAGIVAVGGAAYVWNKHLKEMAAAQAKFVLATSATSEKMKKVGAITGKVGASELAAKKAEGGLFNDYLGRERKGQAFGKDFLGADVGKSIQKAFVDNVKKNGAREAAKALALELSAYVSDGVMTAEQANSVADQIGINLKDSTYSIAVTGELRSLIGPNGEDITKDPLTARLRIISTSQKRSEVGLSDLQNAQKEGGAREEAARLAAYGVNNVQIAQAQADATQKMYDDQIRTLEAQKALTQNKQEQLKIQQKIDAAHANEVKDMTMMNGIVENTLQKEMKRFRLYIMEADRGGPDWSTEDSKEGTGTRSTDQAYFDSLQTTVTERYKGTDQEKAAETAIKALKDTNQGGGLGDLFAETATDKGFKARGGYSANDVATQFEARMTFMMGSGQMSPTQVNSLMTMFDKDLGKLDKTLSIGAVLHGNAKTIETLMFFSGFGDKDLAKRLAVNIIKSDPAQYESINKTLSSLEFLDGSEIDLEVVLKTNGMATLISLSKKLEDIDKNFNTKEPITLDYITKFDTEYGTNLKAMGQKGIDWVNNFTSEKDRNQAVKTYQELVTAYSIQFADPLAKQQWIDDQADKAAIKAAGTGKDAKGKSGTFDQLYKEYLVTFKAQFTTEVENFVAGKDSGAALTGAMTALGTDSKISSAAANGTPSGSEGERDTTYDEIMKRLRNVRLAALNTAGGFKELQKAIAATGSKAIRDQFNGLEQQLIKMGQSAQFTDYLAGLETKELQKFGKVATKKGTQKYTTVDPETGEKVTKTQKYKKGDFVLNQKGRDMEAGFNKAIIGDYNKEQLKSVTLAKQEIAARGKLLALGFDERDIKTMLADENYKALIATNKVTKAELETNAALTKQQRIRNQINGAVAGLKDKIQISEDQKRIPEVVKMMQDAGMNAEGIREAISDPEMLSTLINGMDNFATLAKDAQAEFNHLLSQIDEIPDRKIIELVFTRTESEKRIAAADAASEMFDAYKMIDENTLKNDQGNTYAGLQVQMDDLNNQAKIAQNAINITQSKIDTMQQQVDKDQRDIETNFTRPIEQKQRAIDKLNRAAEMNFVRPIQALQDRSNILSHDLEVMNHAAEQINEKYDKQQEALSRVAEVNQQIIQQQQQQLGLADAITQGDIAAAARAAQDMRATSASNYAGNAEKALQQARQNEIDSLRGGVSGKSQKDIQEEQYQIGQQVYGLERQKALTDADILKIQDEIYNLEQGRIDAQDKIQVKVDEIAKIQYGALLTQQNDLKAINDKILPLQQQSDILFKMIADADSNRKIQELTRAEWTAIKLAAEATEKLAKGDLAKALGTVGDLSNAAKTAWDSIKDSYNAIKDKSVTIKQYIEEIYGKNPGQSPVTDQKPDTKPDPKVDAMSALAGAKTTDDINKAVKTAQAAGVGASQIANGMIAPLIASGADAASAAVTARWTGQGLAWQQQEDAKKAAEAKATEAARAIAARRAAQAGYLSSGGLVPKYFAAGGYARGTDTVPAMLTPGEFVMSRYAVNHTGLDNMKAINSGASLGNSVYNYNLSVNVKSDANPDDIARTVMTQIRQIDSQRIRGNRF